MRGRGVRERCLARVKYGTLLNKYREKGIGALGR